MKVNVDPDVCIGCGLCASMEPSVYQMGDDGLAKAYAEAGPDTEDQARQAMESCPVGAISEE